MPDPIVATVVEPKREPRPTRYIAMFPSGVFAIGSASDTPEAAAARGDPSCAIVTIPGTAESALAAREKKGGDAHASV